MIYRSLTVGVKGISIGVARTSQPTLDNPCPIEPPFGVEMKAVIVEGERKIVGPSHEPHVVYFAQGAITEGKSKNTEASHEPVVIYFAQGNTSNYSTTQYLLH